MARLPSGLGLRMRSSEPVVGAILFLFGALTAILSLNLNIGTINRIGTGFFPLVLGILLMVLASIYLVQSILDQRKALAKEKSQDAPKVSPATSGTKAGTSLRIGQPMINVITVAGSMIFFALFLDALGYPLCVLLTLIALLRVLGLKNWAAVLIIAVISAIGSWLLFAKMLQIPLPRGFIGL